MIDICCGYWHIIVLTNDGEVYGWGGNNWVQIGIGSDERHVTKTTQLLFNVIK